jgi:8-oxo-dGTP diphosphatase
VNTAESEEEPHGVTNTMANSVASSVASSVANSVANAAQTLELVVDVAVLTIRQGRLSVVAARREQFPHIGAWSLLSAPLLAGEDTDAVAERVLFTQAGAHSGRDTMFVEQLRTYSAPGRVPDRWVASVAYVALIADVGLTVGELGALDARVFAIDDLGITPSECAAESGVSPEAIGTVPVREANRVLAFDHDLILVDAIERVRSKFEYTTVATSLVTEPFTIPELRRVYESVWGVNLHPANFRRKVLATPGFVVPLVPGHGVANGAVNHAVNGEDADKTEREGDQSGSPVGKKAYLTGPEAQRRWGPSGGPDLFRRGTAALLHPAMLRPAPLDE